MPICCFSCVQHEKIIRGLVMGLALIMYGCEEGAEPMIEQMSHDPDPIIRFGAMYVIGLAYRGTANNAATQKLLHFAVSDVSDDVRRAAVMCLGFVLMGSPEQVSRLRYCRLQRRGLQDWCLMTFL
jgi:26S proteasome regulatory subunit N2